MATPDYTSRRRSIVEKIIAKLQDGNVTDARDFFSNPFREISEDELPAIKVGVIHEETERVNTIPEYKRTADIVVAYAAQGNDKLANTLYYRGEQIENFLINDDNTTQLDGLLDELELKSMDLIMENGAAGTGAIVLKFQGVYYTEHRAPLDTLEKVAVEIKPNDAPADDPPLFSETITLPSD